MSQIQTGCFVNLFDQEKRKKKKTLQIRYHVLCCFVVHENTRLHMNRHMVLFCFLRFYLMFHGFFGTFAGILVVLLSPVKFNKLNMFVLRFFLTKAICFILLSNAQGFIHSYKRHTLFVMVSQMTSAQTYVCIGDFWNISTVNPHTSFFDYI